MEPIQIYISRALTKASASLKARAEALESAIRSTRPQWRVTEFFGLGPSATDGEIPRSDLEKVDDSDLIVVLADEDTWGGGIEVGWGLAHGRKVLFIASADWKKTRMITGMPELFPDLCVFERCEAERPAEGDSPAVTFEGQAIAFIERAIARLKVEGKLTVEEMNAIEAENPVLAGRIP